MITVISRMAIWMMPLKPRHVSALLITFVMCCFALNNSNLTYPNLKCHFLNNIQKYF